MFKKIIEFFDSKHFGDKVFVYQGKNCGAEIYLTIIKDREEIAYFIVDNTLTDLYPYNIEKDFPGFRFDIVKPPETIGLCLDIDLSRYGKSKCPEFIRKLILMS